MSHNSVPSYNSPLFTENPVFSGTKYGSNVISAVSYENTSEISGDEKYGYYREKLRNNLKLLKNYADVKITDLTDKQLENFDSVIEALSSLQTSETEYPQIYKDVIDNFDDKKTELKSGTVRTFFLSCFNSSTGRTNVSKFRSFRNSTGQNIFFNF